MVERDPIWIVTIEYTLGKIKSKVRTYVSCQFNQIDYMLKTAILYIKTEKGLDLEKKKPKIVARVQFKEEPNELIIFNTRKFPSI